MDDFRPQSSDLSVKEGHQEIDFSVRMIVVSVVFLTIAGVLVLVASIGILRGLEWWEKKNDAQLTPIQEQLNQQRATEKQPEGVKPPPDWDERAHEENHLQKTFPEPRLQYDDATDMSQLRKTEDKRLNSIGKSPDGTVQIPITRAMELLSKEGLPKVSGSFAPSVPLPVEPVTNSPDAKTKGGTKKAGQQ